MCPISMSKLRTRAERFDEAFKMLLITMSITLSGSIAFYKETMEPQFFLRYSIYVCINNKSMGFSTLRSGTHEYTGKIVALYFLMILYETIFARLSFTVFLLPPLMISVIVLVSLSLTLQILRYLRETIGRKNYRDFRRFFPAFTLFLVVLDVLYFLNFITFPLF